MMNSNDIFLDAGFGFMNTSIRPSSCVSVIGEISDQEFERLSDAVARAFDGRPRQWKHPAALGGMPVRDVGRDVGARGGDSSSGGSGAVDVRGSD